LRRLASDFEQVKKEFAGHRYIVVTPIGSDPPERYSVIYFVNGICMMPDGSIETRNRHEAEIVLHAEYPRYKPLCRLNTPIWHPNFRDGQICIGDIWGAGESLSDVIINIGDMIQYRSWNSYSPLSADAARWAIENKHLFPVGDINLYTASYENATKDFDIDLIDDAETSADADPKGRDAAIPPAPEFPSASEPERSEVFETGPVVQGIVLDKTPEKANDFDITAEELEGIDFVPAINRMHGVSLAGTASGKRFNFKTVLVKGVLWAFLGAILAFVATETIGGVTDTTDVLRWRGYDDVAAAMDYFYYGYDFDYDSDAFDVDLTDAEINDLIAGSMCVSTALWSAVLALFLGLLLGVGEGVYYGSARKCVLYAFVGAGISLVLGFISGYVAQAMYSSMLGGDAVNFLSGFIRGLAWALMGLGIGLGAGLIRRDGKRVLYCALGGLAGGFLGGFLFNGVNELFNNLFDVGANDTGTGARAVGIIVMGILIGLGVGLLEQFAKRAWLKVIRGAFEGKEYLIFAGTTAIGSTGKNAIVLFKDKLVGPHHCDIVLEGRKYVLVDAGTPMGTTVNGMRVARHILRQGDSIAVGNSVLMFNMR
jgi:ubiquitin-protein ligase